MKHTCGYCSVNKYILETCSCKFQFVEFIYEKKSKIEGGIQKYKDMVRNKENGS